MSENLKIRRNDKVKILTGKDRGKVGKVAQVLKKERLIVVEGLNQHIKNIRPKREGEKGQKIEFHAPMHISNVMLIDPKTSKPTRVGYRIGMSEGGKKTKERVARKTNEPIPQSKST